MALRNRSKFRGCSTRRRREISDSGLLETRPSVAFSSPRRTGSADVFGVVGIGKANGYHCRFAVESRRSGSLTRGASSYRFNRITRSYTLSHTCILLLYFSANSQKSLNCTLANLIVATKIYSIILFSKTI